MEVGIKTTCIIMVRDCPDMKWGWGVVWAASYESSHSLSFVGMAQSPPLLFTKTTPPLKDVGWTLHWQMYLERVGLLRCIHSCTT